jgi:hypothetical protein
LCTELVRHTSYTAAAALSWARTSGHAVYYFCKAA